MDKKIIKKAGKYFTQEDQHAMSCPKIGLHE